MKSFAITLLFMLAAAAVSAQDSSKSQPFSVSLKFAGVPIGNIAESDTNYQTALSVSPAFSFHHHGWGLAYSPAFVTGGQKKGIYMHAVSVGYESSEQKNLQFETHYAHFFFTNNTDVPYTPISNEIYLSTSYSGIFLEPFIETSFGFGTDSSNAFSDDIGLSAGLRHDISLKENGIFTSIDITPSLLVNAGTNGYFSFLQVSKYISSSHHFSKYVKKDSKGKGSDLFQLANIEANLDTEFKKGSFSLHPSGSIFIPVQGSTDQTVSGYVEFSLQYSF